MMKRAAEQVRAPFLLIAFLVLTGGSPADNPAAVVAAAAGHPARLHVRAETSSMQDARATSVTLDVAGTSRLERRCRGALCSGAWFDGTRAYTFGLNPTLDPVDAPENAAARTFEAIASTAFGEADFVAGGGRVSLLPSGASGRRRLLVAAPGGSDLVAVVDARSGRLDSIDRPDGTTYSRVIASGVPPAVVYAAMRFDRVFIAAGPLAAPAPPAVVFHEPAETRLLPGPLPLVACRLGGLPATCLLDSGTTPSAVTLAFAERLGREPYGEIEISALGSYLTGVIDGGALEVGAARFDDLQFAVIPHAQPADFDVIVGSDVLAELHVELDPVAGRALIGHPAANGGSRVSFRAGLPYVEAKLGLTAAREMLLDTGDSGTVSIGYDQYRDDPELFRPAGSISARGLAGTSMAAVTGELSDLDLDGKRLGPLPIAAVRGQHEGHLGYGIAARCGRLVLELANALVRCTPRTDENRPSAGHDGIRP